MIFPALQRIEVPSTADMGVAVDGSDKWWPAEPAPALLPTFSPYQSQPAQYVEVFNRGTTAFDYRIEAAAPYVRVWPNRGTVTKQVRATVFVDWSRAPRGTTQVPITITGPNGSSVVVQAVVQNPDLSRSPRGTFAEANGYVSMLAQHATRTTGNWLRIPDIGRDGDGMRPSPVTAPRVTPGGDTPHLDFTMNLTTTGPVTVWAYLSPRNNVHPTDGLSYAVSVDGAPPQVVNVTTATGANDTTMNRQWETNTSNNVNRTATTHQIDTPGVHTLRFWMVDPTVILQKLVVDTGGLRPSYLGPPESRRF